MNTFRNENSWNLKKKNAIFPGIVLEFKKKIYH